MFRKIALILIFSLMMLNVSALDIEQFSENQTQTTVGDIAKMKGELTLKIETEADKTRVEFVNQSDILKEELKTLIDEKTNPFLINMPVIILIIIFGLIWMILKARGKV